MIRSCLIALATCVLAMPTAAQIAVAGNVGTPGLGAEVQVGLGPVFTVRATIDRLDHDFDESFGDVEWSGDFAFDTVGGFVDMHPFANAFLISGGAYLGTRDIRLDARPTVPVEIGGATFTPAQVGRLEGTIKLSDLSPFIGIGFDDTMTRSGPFGVRALVGVAFSEDPEVGLSSSGGTLSNDPAFRARLEAEAREIGEEADYGLFPVAQLGLTYRF
jgi:hypothetical protein